MATASRLANVLHSESPRGGYINAPQLTDSLVHQVCAHNGLGCQVLWRMARLVPHVPLKRRTWLDKDKMSKVADFVLTEDQKFDVASSVGVSVSIIGISEIDLVNSFWTGHVGFKLKVGFDVYLHHSGPFLADETNKALKDAANSKSLSPEQAKELEILMAAEIGRWQEGCAAGTRPLPDGPEEMKPAGGDATAAENCMRFAGFGIINAHVVGDDPYPKVTGDEYLWVDTEANMLVAEWCIESKWYNQPTLKYFPFDSHEMCAIFWTQTWKRLRIANFGRSYGLGTMLQEFEILGFRGDSKPVSGWDPYVCECNVVPNLGRPGGEPMIYGRFWIRRKPFYFLASLLFPTAVVALMGGFAIMIAAGESPNGIVMGGESPLSLVAGLILTMMAMKFSYADSLPKLGYLTMLDIYILGSFCLLSLAAFVITLLDEETLQATHATAVFFAMCLLFNAIWAAVAWQEYHIPEEKHPQLTFTDETLE